MVVKEFIILNFLHLIIAIALRVFANPLGNVYQKKLTEKGSNPLFINAITYMVLSLSCIPFLFRTGFGSVSASFWIYSAIVGLLGGLGNAFLIKALQDGELSVLGPINAYKSILGLIFGALILHEFPNFYCIIGMLLIIAGSYFVFAAMDEKFSLAIFKRKDIQYRFYALFFCALEAVFIKKIIILSSVTGAFVSWCLFGALFSLLILIIKFKQFDFSAERKVLNSRHASFYLNIVICVGIMQYTTNYVFSHMNVAYALSLFQLSCLASIFFGFKVFNEKNILKKLFGAVIMIAGSVLILLFR